MTSTTLTEFNSINIHNRINKIEEQYKSLYNRLNMYLLLNLENHHTNSHIGSQTHTKHKNTTNTTTHTDLIFNLE